MQRLYSKKKELLNHCKSIYYEIKSNIYGNNARIITTETDGR